VRGLEWEAGAGFRPGGNRAGAAEGGEIDVAVTALVEAGMDLFLRGRCGGVKLHSVGFDAHDSADLSGEEDVRDLGEHRVGQVLDHQAETVGFGPAGAEDRAGLGLTGFEGDAGPAEFASEADHAPVVRAFVKEKRFAGGNGMDVEAISFEVVREGCST